MGSRFFVVGDIHACPQELEILLTSLSLEPEDRLVFLGDYVDRGPDARAVVDLLLGMKASAVCQMTFLKGNHEDMFLDFLGYSGRYGEAFLVNGGNTTVKSYGLPPTLIGQEAADALPPAHLEFYLALETIHVNEETFCVHAGLNPRRPLQVLIAHRLDPRQHSARDVATITREQRSRGEPQRARLLGGHPRPLRIAR